MATTWGPLGCSFWLLVNGAWPAQTCSPRWPEHHRRRSSRGRRWAGSGPPSPRRGFNRPACRRSPPHRRRPPPSCTPTCASAARCSTPATTWIHRRWARHPTWCWPASSVVTSPVRIPVRPTRLPLCSGNRCRRPTAAGSTACWSMRVRQWICATTTGRSLPSGLAGCCVWPCWRPVADSPHRDVSGTPPTSSSWTATSCPLS